MEIEGQHQTAPPAEQGLVVNVQTLRVLTENAIAAQELEHPLIEAAKIAIFQVGIVHEAPLTPCVFSAVTVALPGEVDPLRVAEFIAHEIQIALAAQRSGDKADDLVIIHGPLNHRRWIVLVHMPVHLRIGQPEHDGLVSHQGLIVGLAVCDGLLLRPARGEHPVHLTDVPVLVPLGLEGTDPEIGHAHAQAIVKADAALPDGQAHAGHAGHVLCNGDGHGIDAVDQLVGKLEIGHRVRVGVHGEVLVVVIEGGAQTVVMIEHAGDAVEPESIEMELLDPVLAVGKQEMLHLRLGIVKQAGVPGGVIAPLAGDAVEVVRAVKLAQTFRRILHGMRMDDVQKDTDAHAVGCVDQLPELIRGTKAGTGRKEIRHLIAKGGIVRMLHDRHDLDAVVTAILYPGQHILGELPVGSDALLLIAHADVAFVDQRISGTTLLEKSAIGPLELFLRIPDLAGEAAVRPGLTDPVHVGGDALDPAPVRKEADLHILSVLKGFQGQLDLPVAPVQPGHAVGILVPTVEVAHQRRCLGMGRPFPINPAGLGLVEAIIQISVGQLPKALGAGEKFCLCRGVQLHAQVQIPRVGLQHGINF